MAHEIVDRQFHPLTLSPLGSSADADPLWNLGISSALRDFRLVAYKQISLALLLGNHSPHLICLNGFQD